MAVRTLFVTSFSRVGTGNRESPSRRACIAIAIAIRTPVKLCFGGFRSRGEDFSKMTYLSGVVLTANGNWDSSTACEAKRRGNQAEEKPSTKKNFTDRFSSLAIFPT